MLTVLAIFELVMALGIAGVWTADILSGQVDLRGGPFHAREAGSESLLWPHWLAEHGKAALLLCGGLGLLMRASLGAPVSLVGLGACP